MEIKFIVYGNPVGKGRPRFTRGGHTYTPEKTKEYENKIRECWRAQSGKGFAGGVPLQAIIKGYFPIPSSLSKKKRFAMCGTPHTKKCDADNLAKAVLDALNGCAYPDDSAISILDVSKSYAEEPRVEVLLRTIEGGKHEHYDD